MSQSNETKKQHFVSATYLSKWDLNAPKNSRKAKLWWTDGSKSLPGIAENLAHQRYLYAKANTHLSEAYFGEYEGDWNKQVLGLAKPRHSRYLLSLMLLQAIVSACRNPSLRMSTNHTRFNATVSAIDTVVNKVLLRSGPTKSLPAMSLALHSEWQMTVFRREKASFLTCDNPTTLLVHGKDSLSAVLLPITPFLLFSAARKSSLRIFRETLSETEVAAVNSYTTANSHRMVFSYEPFEHHQLGQIAQLKSRNRHRGKLGSKTMRLNTLRFPIAGLSLPMTPLVR